MLRYILEKKPLLFCIWSAFAFRMVAVFFSQGIAFGYEHYVYVENSQMLLSGDITLTELLTSENQSFADHGYSLLYLLLNWLILQTGELFGIFDPQSKMFIIRLVHALASLLSVYYSYRIARTFSSRKVGLAVGLAISMLWFEPYMSVRNFAECVSSILLLAGFYRIAKYKQLTFKYADDLFTGFLMGLGTSISYSSGIFVIGVFISFIIRENLKRALYFLLGSLISLFAFEGLVDIIFFNQPFYSIIEYCKSILTGHLSSSGPSCYYMYFSILLLVFLFPWGIAAIFAFFRSWKKYFMLFFPVFFYIIAHYIIPYKQERFMLNILPFYIILTIAGWNNYYNHSKFWTIHKKLYNTLILSFIIINMLLMIITATAFTRKSQVETMLYLSRNRSEITSILVDDCENSSSKTFPPFYFGGKIIQYTLNKQEKEPDKSIISSYINNYPNIRELYSEKYFENIPDSLYPQYILFYGDYKLEQRVEKIKTIFNTITYQQTITPSISDRIIQYFNKKNRNMPVYIYKVGLEN
ncbi:MAG: hypothetical protein MJ211_03460 [Bacteroidales bacterium]|nr:hypothetical protein [Bacteroidales bacterium]